MDKKKKAKKLEALRIEYGSLNEQIQRARGELGFIEYNKMRVKKEIKNMMKRQEEITKKREKLSGIFDEVAYSTPY